MNPCQPMLIRLLVAAASATTLAQDAGAAGSSPPALSADKAPADRPPVATPFAHLTSRPYPEDVADETAYAHWLSQRAQRIRDAAGRTDDPRESIQLTLAALNWVLAAECEPPMSRLLHGINGDSDLLLVGRLAHQCLTDLETLRNELKEYARNPEHDAEAAAGFQASIDTLDCFAQALNACVAPDGDDGADVLYRQAASALSAYLEDERPNVAAAALLFKAVLYGRAGRIDRAMRLLAAATEPLRSDTVHYDFFARLLRCEYLTRRGGYATAWTLLLSIEERSEDWFGTVRTRTEAARAAILARLRICNVWPPAVPEVEREETTSWCDSITKRLYAEYFGDEGNGAVIRLTTAAPVIVDIPDPPSAEHLHAAPEEPTTDRRRDGGTVGPRDEGTEPRAGDTEPRP